MPPPAALVFDAYGTLFDVHSVTARADSLWPGRGRELSQLWRAKQLEYTWLRTLMQRYEDFGRVTAASLEFACDTLGLPLDAAKREALAAEYLRLAPFPEVRVSLSRLAGIRLGILSNGSPGMLEPLVAHAGLSDVIRDVLSVDAVQAFKPDPQVYRLAVDRIGAAASEIGFVSSNCWDALGAKSFGFRVFWVNRNRLPVDRLGLAPDHVLETLADLPPLVS